MAFFLEHFLVKGRNLQDFLFDIFQFQVAQVCIQLIGGNKYFKRHALGCFNRVLEQSRGVGFQVNDAVIGQKFQVLIQEPG